VANVRLNWKEFALSVVSQILLNFYPPQFLFCGKCAHNLTLPSEASPKDLSFDEKLDKIQRYLPKGLTEKVLSQRDKIEGERKQVTG
jgi:hypothetical protein